MKEEIPNQPPLASNNNIIRPTPTPTAKKKPIRERIYNAYMALETIVLTPVMTPIIGLVSPAIKINSAIRRYFDRNQLATKKSFGATIIEALIKSPESILETAKAYAHPLFKTVDLNSKPSNKTEPSIATSSSTKATKEAPEVPKRRPPALNTFKDINASSKDFIHRWRNYYNYILPPMFATVVLTGDKKFIAAVGEGLTLRLLAKLIASNLTKAWQKFQFKTALSTAKKSFNTSKLKNPHITIAPKGSAAFRTTDLAELASSSSITSDARRQAKPLSSPSTTKGLKLRFY